MKKDIRFFVFLAATLSALAIKVYVLQDQDLLLPPSVAPSERRAIGDGATPSSQEGAGARGADKEGGSSLKGSNG